MTSPMSPNNVKYGNWQKQNVLGSGGFGQVSLWVNVVTQEKIAIKLCKQQLLDRQFVRWEQEVKIMKELQHESIVSFREVPKDIQKKYVGSFVALGMEFCELGDLRRMLGQPKNCCGLPEFQVRDFLSNIGSGIQFLHKKKIIHRDIKPENIVMKGLSNDRIQYKLIDLGYAKDLNENSCGTSFVGTIHYLAPEFSTTQDLRYTETVDFWSFGLVSFECITGRRPFFPHFDNAMQFLSVLREKKRDENICTTEDDEPNPPFLSTIPQPHSLNSILASKLSNWLQKMLMLDAKLRGGGEGASGWYDHLQEILREKHVQVCNTTSNSVVTIPVEAGWSMWIAKEKISQQTGIEPEHQMILFRDGDEPNVMKNVVGECWREPSNDDWKLLLFTQKIKPTISTVSIPKKVEGLAETSKNSQGSRAVRRVLCLATHFIYAQCRSCEQVLKALFALQKCVEKRYTFFCRSMNDLKRSYYSMLGQLEIYSKSLIKDKDELEKLEAAQNSGEYDSILDTWHSESERLESYQKDDIPQIERFLKYELELTGTPFLIRNAEQFVSQTMNRLSEIIKSCYQHYDSIKVKVRNFHNTRRPRPAAEPAPADNGQELRASLNDLLVKFIQPSSKEITAYTNEALNQIPVLVKIVMDDLPPYVVKFKEVNAVVSSIVQHIQDDQSQRQQTLWNIANYCKEEVHIIHSHCYNAYEQTVESVPAEADPGTRLTQALRNQRSRFAQLMHGFKHETSMNDLLSLDWQYLHSEGIPPEPSGPSGILTYPQPAPPPIEASVKQLNLADNSVAASS